MKTPAIILKECGVIDTDFILPGSAIELAMKEYAKQWVHKFSLETLHNLSTSDYEFMTNRLEPHIKRLIDAH